MRNNSINVKDLKKSINGFRRVTSRLIDPVIKKCQEDGFVFDSYALKYDMGKKFKLESQVQDNGQTRFTLDILSESGDTERMYCYTMNI